jgi:hypothetical protein
MKYFLNAFSNSSTILLLNYYDINPAIFLYLSYPIYSSHVIPVKQVAVLLLDCTIHKAKKTIFPFKTGLKQCQRV